MREEQQPAVPPGRVARCLLCGDTFDQVTGESIASLVWRYSAWCDEHGGFTHESETPEGAADDGDV